MRGNGQGGGAPYRFGSCSLSTCSSRTSRPVPVPKVLITDYFLPHSNYFLWTHSNREFPSVLETAAMTKTCFPACLKESDQQRLWAGCWSIKPWVCRCPNHTHLAAICALSICITVKRGTYEAQTRIHPEQHGFLARKEETTREVLRGKLTAPFPPSRLLWNVLQTSLLLPVQTRVQVCEPICRYTQSI